MNVDSCSKLENEYKTKENTSIGSILSRIIQEETIRSIDFILNNKNHFLVNRLRNRLDPKFPNRKPANSSAEDRNPFFLNI
jgi:hypothetical protein